MNAQEIEEKLSKTFPKMLNSVIFQADNEVLITFKTKTLIKLKIDDVKDMWNHWAQINRKAQIKVVSPVRSKGIKKALKYYPHREDWEQIFKGIESDSFWFKVMDFDKLYRNENFNKFYELGSVSEQQEFDPLEEFFKKHNNLNKDS